MLELEVNNRSDNITSTWRNHFIQANNKLYAEREETKAQAT